MSTKQLKLGVVSDHRALFTSSGFGLFKTNKRLGGQRTNPLRLEHPTLPAMGV